MEDYKKKYEEALQRARGLYKEFEESEDIAVMVDLGLIFPELKESEDKMIRKELIEFVKSRGGFKQEYISWLEKQAEQKPSEWSDTDLICLGYLADFVDKNGDEFYGKNKPNVVKWIHSFANLTTPKQEWSEEDIKHFRRCLGYIEAYVEPRRDDVRWFKSLKDRVHPQPQQEWSEEDERRIEECAREAEDNNCIILAKHIRQLKSLSSQWKPSEEMLEALYRAVPQNVKEISEDEILLDKLYQGLKYGRVISNN